jgi:hypothetical protein
LESLSLEADIEYYTGNKMKRKCVYLDMRSWLANTSLAVSGACEHSARNSAATIIHRIRYIHSSKVHCPWLKGDGSSIFFRVFKGGSRNWFIQYSA